MSATFDGLIAELRKLAKNDGDRRLVDIFERHKGDIQPHFENCLYENRGDYFASRYPDAPSGLDWFGPMFHKGFRQMDILPTGEQDSEVWQLLSTGSEMFWTAAENIIKDTP